MPSVVRAIDVGFGQTKYTVAVRDGSIECAHFPSVALPSMLPSASRPIVGGRRKTVEILTNSMYYEVGPDVHNVLQQVAEAIASEIGESYEERDTIDLTLRKQKPLMLYGKAHSIERYRPIVDSIAQDAVRAMLAVVGGGYRFDNIVLVGGGAHLFKKALRAAFPKQKLHEVADPMFANVRGFQRAGMDKLGSQPIATAHAQE